MNPFAHIPASVCDTLALPTIPDCQLGTAYSRLPTQVLGLLLVQPDGNRPSDWSSADGWAGVVKNIDDDPAFGRYLVGIGSFLPLETTRATLAGGRYELSRERVYQVRFRALNTKEAGHMTLMRQVENNYRYFDVWIETVGGRIVGGQNGMRPIYADATFPLAENPDGREYIDFTFNFTFYQFPDTALIDVDFQSQTYFWGDPDAGEIWGDGSGEGWGWES